MKLVQPGIILFTERYEACVQFYHDLCGLPVLFAKETLTCLHFGEAYLMIESGGQAAPVGAKGRESNPTVLRFNVEDVEAAATELQAKGVTVAVEHYEWGTIGVFHDPDGNRCELKDAWDVVLVPTS